MALREKHRAFVNEYLSCFNATEAYERVYSPSNRETSASNGYRLLRNAEIAEAIRQHLQAKAMSAEEVVMRLAEQARGSIEDFVDVQEGIPNGVFLNFEKAKRNGKLHLIKKLKYNAQGYPEIELHDSQAALTTLLKHHDRGPDGSEDDPINHVIRRITEVRPGPDATE